MFGQRESNNKNNHSVIRMPSAHEDLVFSAIQHITQLLDRAIEGQDDKLSSHEAYAIRATSGWDSHQYNAARKSLKESRRKIVSEMAQQLKFFWLDAKIVTLDSDHKSDAAFGVFGEDESQLAMKLELRSVTERLRERYIRPVSQMKEKINILIGRTIFQFERCPFDTSQMVMAFINSLQTTKVSTRHKMMALKFFESRVGCNLGGFYAKISDRLDDKIDTADKRLSEDLLTTWFDAELFTDDETKMEPAPAKEKPRAVKQEKRRPQKQPPLKVDSRRLLTAVNSLSRKIKNVDFPGSAFSVRENVLGDLKCSGSSSVAFSQRCEKAMRYVDSKTRAFKAANDPSIADGVQMKLQLVLLKFALEEQDFNESRNPNLCKMVDILSQLARKHRCPSSLSKTIHGCLDKLLSVEKLEDGFCGKVVSAIKQKVSDISSPAGVAVQHPHDDSLSESIREFLRKSLPANSPKLLRFLVKRVWFERLNYIARREGKGSEAWQVQIERLNSLVWSMQRTHQEPKLLRSKLPTVFASVKDNIRFMDWHDDTGDLLMEKLNHFFARRISESVAMEVRQLSASGRRPKPNSIF